LRDGADVLEALTAGLKPSLKSKITCNEVSRFTDAGYDFNLRYEIDGLDDAERAELQERVDLLSRPAQPGEILKELTKLKAKTKMRATDATEAKTIIAAWGEELSEYPIWAIRRACKAIADRDTFFPAWAEMRTRLRYEMAPVRAMERAAQGRGGEAA